MVLAKLIRQQSVLLSLQGCFVLKLSLKETACLPLTLLGGGSEDDSWVEWPSFRREVYLSGTARGPCFPVQKSAVQNCAEGSIRSFV